MSRLTHFCGNFLNKKFGSRKESKFSHVCPQDAKIIKNANTILVVQVLVTRRGKTTKLCKITHSLESVIGPLQITIHQLYHIYNQHNKKLVKI